MQIKTVVKVKKIIHKRRKWFVNCRVMGNIDKYYHFDREKNVNYMVCLFKKT